MIDTISHWFHVIAELLYYISPLMMGFVSVLWIILRNRTVKEVNRMHLRCYALERQVEHIVDREKIDPAFINCMQRMYEDYGR